MISSRRRQILCYRIQLVIPKVCIVFRNYSCKAVAVKLPEKSLKDIEFKKNWRERRNGQTIGMISSRRLIISYKIQLYIHMFVTYFKILFIFVPGKNLTQM